MFVFFQQCFIPYRGRICIFSNNVLYPTVIILGRAIGANLSPMAHENMTNGPKWPVETLDGAKFYPDCAEIKKNRNLSVFDTSMLRETFRGKYLYPHRFI